MSIDFLHIGKTGGTFVKNSLKKYDVDKIVKINNHQQSKINNKIISNKFIFIIRDPVNRYVSGFISRLRKGQPTYFVEWTKNENIAFTNFSTPNDLAEALSSSDENIKANALFAIKHIKHTNSISDYINLENLKKNKDKIFYVCKTETLNNDLQNIYDKLGYNNINVELHENCLHKTPPEFENLKKMSNLAIKNIIEYYLNDYEIIKYLINENYIDKQYKLRLSNYK